MRYRLMVDSNFHMNESARRSAGEYDRIEDAIATAKRIVDRSLVEFASRGRTSDELYEYYCLFGDDPFIVGGEGYTDFSARDYARERSREFSGESWYLLVALGRYAEAEPLMLAGTPQTAAADPYGDNTVARAEFYESWGDSLGKMPVAAEKYRESQNYWGLFASWSTSGGEGTARMMDVNRVTEKLERLNAD